MTLGPDVPAWVALREALAALARDAGADAFVLDAWGHLWCTSQPADAPAETEVIALPPPDGPSIA